MRGRINQNLNQYKTPKGFRGKSKLVVQLWRFIYVLFFRTSPQFMYNWRRFLLKAFGAKIGKGILIRPSVKITYPWKVSIGDYSWIGDDVVLYSLGEIEIGKNSVISQRSYICTGFHDYQKQDFPIYSKKIVIKSSCWIATDVFIGPGTTINEGVVIGSRSSVYKDLPPYTVCIGSPAKVVKERKIEE